MLTNIVVSVSPTNQAATAQMAATCFSAAAGGSGTLSYQWYRNGVAVAGQTNRSCVLPACSRPTRQLHVVVANGLQTVTSAPPAVLTVETAPLALVTAQWDFNQGDLRATLGQPLQFADATVQADVQFGSTTTFGISDIAGQPANVMLCNPSTSGYTNWNGFILPHGIAPNGGGSYVNQYTLIMDCSIRIGVRAFIAACGRPTWPTPTTRTCSSTAPTAWASARSMTRTDPR